MTVEKCQCWQRTRNPKKPAGKCDGQELSALTQEICWRRGPGTQGSDWGSGEAAAPGVPFLRLVIFVPSFQQPVQMSGVHTGCLWAGNRTETGNQGLLWCCWWNWVLTEFDLQEKLGHTPSSALMLCSPTVGTCLERHILICFKNYF